MATEKPDKAAPPVAKVSRAEAKFAPEMTAIPGVFKNRAGESVDARGVAVALTDLIAKDRAHTEFMLDTSPRTPAEFLKAIAFDPRLPLHTRMKAANQAAPFFSPKLTALDIFSTLDDETLNSLSSLGAPGVPAAAKPSASANGKRGGDGPPRAAAPTVKQTARTSKDSRRPGQAKPRSRSKP